MPLPIVKRWFKTHSYRNDIVLNFAPHVIPGIHVATNAN